MLGWFSDGFLMVFEGFWMDVWWMCDGRCMEFFLVIFMFAWFLNLMTFEKLMALSWPSLWQSWQSLAGLWQNYSNSWLSYGNVLENICIVYGKGMANLWQSDGDIWYLVPCYLTVLAKLWQEYGKVMTELCPSLAMSWWCYGKAMAKLWPSLWQSYGRGMAKG